jgi:hypothetical protein
MMRFSSPARPTPDRLGRAARFDDFWRFGANRFEELNNYSRQMTRLFQNFTQICEARLTTPTKRFLPRLVAHDVRDLKAPEMPLRHGRQRNEDGASFFSKLGARAGDFRIAYAGLAMPMFEFLSHRLVWVDFQRGAAVL